MGKPIVSNQLPSRQFVLCANSVHHRGMHAVLYSVAEVRSGAVLSCSDSKVDALRLAKEFIASYRPESNEASFLIMEEELRNALEAMEGRRLQDLADSQPRRKMRIGKKRTAIYQKSSGKCHYCAAALVLEDGWHVEHMLPRSRGGTDLMDNLVASCPGCNRRKHSKSADEFIKAVDRMNAVPASLLKRTA